MKPHPLLILAAPALIAIALLHQHTQVTQLRLQNRALQNKIAQLHPPPPPPPATPPQPAPPAATEPAEEITRLRAHVAEQQKDIERLRAELAAIPPVAGLEKLPSGFCCDNLPKTNWQFAGYDTPSAAVQTFLWATAQGDMEAIRAAVAEREQERYTLDFPGQTDAQIAEYGKKRLAEVTGIRILKQDAVTPTNLGLTIYLDGIPYSQQPHGISVIKVGTEWKCTSPCYRRE